MDLVAALRREGVREVSDSVLDRALFASDASLYRVEPRAVVRARHRDDVLAALNVARERGVPLTMRGAGTSIAGNAIGPGIIVDTRGLDRIVSLDPDSRTAVVEPGVVQASLQQVAAAAGLRFGPDPSTHTRCTIGGMIGNNACGSRALGYGRTSDNVEALTVAFGNGETGRLGPGTSGPTSQALRDLVAGELGHVRTNFGRFSRQVSGYSLEHLLPELGGRVERLLVGSEGTLGVVLDATVRLVAEPAARLMVVLGYPSMAEAADDVPALLSAAPLVACEGLDSRLTRLVRHAPDLPRGAGWLLCEVVGEAAAEATAHAQRLITGASCLEGRIVPDPVEAAALWRIREDGAGLAAVALDRPAYAGWEDAAVPPERLGDWLRDFDAMLAEFGLSTVPYGHFGDGCVHARIDFELGREGALREFLIEAATRLRAYGGSLSGEHGDGRARSELLPLMYDAASLDLFARVKRVCDPADVLNPGVLVSPAPLDADLRKVPDGSDRGRAHLRLAHDQGSLAEAVHRCTGVGRCVAATASGVMCPSFQATRDEKDSTRGRARVLQEALDGRLVRGLDDPAVDEALDLCLACKGCASDCPTGVDMATYKSEVLSRRYQGKRRPLSHYTLGRLPAFVRLAPAARGRSWLARVMGSGPGAALARRLAGADPRRSLPALAPTTLRASSRPAHQVCAEDKEVDVWLWADTFTDHFHPAAGRAALALLEHWGLNAQVITQDACCGLTWITTGQIDAAREQMTALVETLTPYATKPILVLEPSCLATVRGDLAELVDDPGDVAASMTTLAELIERLGLGVPDLTGTSVVAQPHCHHHAVLGWEADRRVLTKAGADLTAVGGCCGLAGNFGMEVGHYDLSVAVAETQLLPALRAAPDAVVLADGLSCRHQVADLTGRSARHLAELLAAALGDDSRTGARG